ncbi:hypothetical protein AB0O07_15085 [Streptomyces sp. NPDC093085]|uniref:hypothetical protein n=1 Tax=Streptomyces sp. NPDC093085 TaxID=3155068 RepID=UPI00342EE3FE
MSVDPTDPDTFEPDTSVPATDDEIPEADAAEQRTDAGSGPDEPLTHIDPEKASEGDAADQARSAGPADDEEYR